ncbi:MAG: (2E,6E)-farnesyl diphosphate synthase [Gammaproteobacteria bacterium]
MTQDSCPSQGDFRTLLSTFAERAENALSDRLPEAGIHPAKLHEVMRYAALGGGKRIRPFLVYAAGIALGAPCARLDAAAAAVEFIHAYSLVHDDLPAMDNDDLRRGRPTVHRAYDEGFAVLAGDALQTQAFLVLAHDATLEVDAATRVEMIETLAFASGSRGMCGGQAIDLAAEGQELTLAELEDMHIHKTGALIRSAVLLGAQAAGANSVEIEALDHYAKCIGLAFQIQDDILDVTASTEDLGKQAGADAALNKPTFPALLGLEAAKTRARELCDDAIASLDGFAEGADMLRQVARYIIDRGH